MDAMDAMDVEGNLSTLGFSAARWVRVGVIVSALSGLLAAGAVGQEPAPAEEAQAGATLLAAASGGHLEEVELLLGNGAPADARNEQGETPLMLAALYAHPRVVEALLEAGAHVDAVSLDGSTPLLQAVVGAGEQREEAPELLPVYRRIVEVLLGAGADVGAEDGFGYTALDNARAYELPGLVEVLEKAARW